MTPEYAAHADYIQAMYQESMAWITKEADSAAYIRPTPANHRLLDGHLLGKPFVPTTHQWVVSERFLI